MQGADNKCLMEINRALSLIFQSFTYYPDGSLKTRTDQKGQVTPYTYNVDNRLWKVDYKPDGLNIAETVTYTYEPNGLLASATNAAGTVGFTYDAINRLTASDGALAGTVDQVGYQYYNGRQRQYLNSSLLGQTSYEINDWNALLRMTNPENLVTEYAYNQYTGNLSRVTQDNGVYTDYDFDNLGRLDLLDNRRTSGTISSFDYQYDNANLINTVTVAADHAKSPAGVLRELTVNALNQVTELYTNGQGTTTFSYDLNGNLEEKTEYLETTEYEYDYENRLVGIVYPDGGSSEFVYDALGRRLKTIERDSEGAVIEETHYVYDGLDLIAELDGNNALVASYTFGPGIDDPVSMNYDGADYFFLKNHLGSITEITDIYQNTVKTYDYDPFGNILGESGSLAHNAFTYTAREYHHRSGLYYYRARWYDPEMGRFITQDPIGFLGGMNLYAYVRNNPVMFADPLGLMNWYDNLLQGSADFSAGFGDFITGGLTSRFRENFGLNDNVNQCSKSYSAGEWTGLGWDVAFLAAGGAAVAGADVQLFAHGGKGWHVGMELIGKRNLIHLGMHVQYGLHLAVGYTAPMVAWAHVYFFPPRLFPEWPTLLMGVVPPWTW
jgi:RHS repeat-associated protein